MKFPIVALTVLAAAPGAPAAAQIAPLDSASVAAACGGEMSYDQIPTMPKAEVAKRLGCYTREFASQLSRQLPVKVDPVTTLESVTAEGTTLSYHYRADLLRAQLPREALAGLKAGVRTKVCQSEDMRNTVSIGGAYRYVWNDREGQRIGEMIVTSCPETAAEPQPAIT